MSKYIGQSCVSCGCVFKEGDEIVVCPECGSPYHRECYKNEGRCVNTILHETGESWQPSPLPGARFSAHSSVADSDVVCANCGTKNRAGSAFCSECGVPLSGVRPPFEPGRQAQTDNPAGRPFGVPPFLGFGSISKETDVDGSTVGDYTAYVGENKAYYYIPKFLRFAKSGSKISFNFAALFFPHLWFAYRKMPLYGAIIWLVSMITSIPSVIVLAKGEGAAFGFGFVAIYYICYIINNLLRLFCAVFSNYVYYKKAKADVSRIKQSSADEASLKTSLVSAGGVSERNVFIFIAISVVVSLVAAAFVAPSIASGLTSSGMSL